MRCMKFIATIVFIIIPVFNCILGFIISKCARKHISLRGEPMKKKQRLIYRGISFVLYILAFCISALGAAL